MALEQQRWGLDVQLQRMGVVEQARHVTAGSPELESSLVDWRGLLRANVQQARQAIRKLLDGRLAVTPDEHLTEFEIKGDGLIELPSPQLFTLSKAGVTLAGPAHSGLTVSLPFQNGLERIWKPTSRRTAKTTALHRRDS